MSQLVSSIIIPVAPSLRERNTYVKYTNLFDWRKLEHLALEERVNFMQKDLGLKSTPCSHTIAQTASPCSAILKVRRGEEQGEKEKVRPTSIKA